MLGLIHLFCSKKATFSLCVSISYFCNGLVRGYSSPAIPSMKEKSNYLLPDENIASWVTSIPPTGALCGSLVAFPLLHFLGRRTTGMFIFYSSFLSSLLTSFTFSFSYVYISHLDVGMVFDCNMR